MIYISNQSWWPPGFYAIKIFNKLSTDYRLLMIEKSIFSITNNIPRYLHHMKATEFNLNIILNKLSIDYRLLIIEKSIFPKLWMHIVRIGMQVERIGMQVERIGMQVGRTGMQVERMFWRSQNGLSSIYKCPDWL